VKEKDKIDKAYKDKMDVIYASQSGKTPKWMAWFQVRGGYYRGIGVEKQKDVTDVLTQDEMATVYFEEYVNPKHK